jgi:hypothetical protein
MNSVTINLGRASITLVSQHDDSLRATEVLVTTQYRPDNPDWYVMEEDGFVFIVTDKGRIMRVGQPSSLSEGVDIV